MIPVYDSDGTLAVAIFIMDSGSSNGCNLTYSYGCVDYEQV